jgi:regulator of extracellular matrix RemA (YlzA/DUF370 family)
MDTELIHLGFGNILAINRVVAIVAPSSEPIRRLIQKGKGDGLVFDMTKGRRTKAVLMMDSGHIVLAAITPETITSRLSASRTGSALKGQSEGESETG